MRGGGGSAGSAQMVGELGDGNRRITFGGKVPNLNAESTV